MFISSIHQFIPPSSNKTEEETQQIDPFLPPTDENKRQLLSELNRMIEEISNTESTLDSLEKRAILEFLLTIRSSLYIYFGDLKQAVADREKLLGDLEESDEEAPSLPYNKIFDLFIKGEDEAAFGALAKYIDGDISPMRTVFLSLLFKAKGRTIPSIQFEDRELESNLFNEKQYEELITLATQEIESGKHPWQQKKPLYIRLLSKAMLNDFSASLEDIDRIGSINSSLDDENQMIRALLHYLDGNEEKAKASFEQISFSKDQIEPETLLDWVYAFNERKWEAIVIERLLQL